MGMNRWVWVGLLLGACTGGSPAVDAGRYSAVGPFAVGSVHATMHNRDGGRALPVELWYPAAGGTGSFPVEEFEEGARRTRLKAWVDEAPEKCTPRLAHSQRDAALAEGSAWPVVMMSHCTEGFRFSLHSIAERLASHGFVVAAPDHVDNTRFDAGAPLTNAFLAVRADDISGVLDALLDPGSTEVPAVLRGKLDAARVAMVGHSFGAVTTAKVVELDARVKGGFLIAAPADSPFLNAGSVTSIKRPLSYLLALEDNSISYLGNGFIRDNFARTPKPSWLLEVKEAGHWTFSDIAGLGGAYKPGCGDGLRDPDGGAFTYLDNDTGRGIAQRAVSAWAAQLLRDDAAAAFELSISSDVVTVKKR